MSMLSILGHAGSAELLQKLFRHLKTWVRRENGEFMQVAFF